MVTNYWFVVVDNQSGAFLNAQMNGNHKNYEEAVEMFQNEFPRYSVIEGGEGIENRPKAYRELPYVS